MEVVACSCMLSVLFTSVVFYNPEHAYNAVEAAIYASITPVVWSVGLFSGAIASMLGTKCEL